MSSWRSIPTQDRISDLPDSLLCHILSFIPTKLAITTSVLSKRWKSLWRSVLTLNFNFDDKTFKNFTTFCRFVDSVIESRGATQPLLGIQNFNLNSKPFFYDPLTPSVVSVLTCRTLVVLKLKNLIIDYVPQLVDLRSLKTLNLVSIYFLTNYVDFERLFYGCPILENLKTNCLLSLDLPHSNSDSEGDYKAFSKLVRANLSNFSWVHLTFAWVNNVKFLHVELLSPFGKQVPTFHNLTHLELIFKVNFLFSHKWKWVIQVLQHCPKLQNLTIDEASHDILVDKDWEVESETVPECLSSQLRTCSFKGLRYIDIECELQFAKYIMVNSKLLCTMTIKSSSLVRKKAKDQMLVSLSSCPRGSATCKLLVD